MYSHFFANINFVYFCKNVLALSNLYFQLLSKLPSAFEPCFRFKLTVLSFPNLGGVEAEGYVTDGK